MTTTIYVNNGKQDTVLNERAYEALMNTLVPDDECGAVIDGIWGCTRAEGHAGPHVAIGSGPIAVWTDEFSSRGGK